MKFQGKKITIFFILTLGAIIFSPSFTRAADEPILNQANDFLGNPIDKPVLTTDELQELAKKPMNKIHIPGLEYGDMREIQDGDKRYLYIPFIGQYLSVVYKYLVIFAGIIAVIIIIISGIQWTASGGNSSTIESAKTRITGALTGLGLAVGSYIILYAINPNLVNFSDLKVVYIQGDDIAEFLTHGDDNPNTSDTPASYSGSGRQWTVPGTEETVELSTKDVCFFNTFGKDQAELNSNIGKACLFGDHCVRVHKLIAPELQKRFDLITNSTDPTILAWKDFLFDPTYHSSGKGKTFDPITASGAFSPNGHGSDQKFIEKFGAKYDITNGGGGIAVTAKSNLLSKKMSEDEVNTYQDKNGVTRHTRPPKTWVANGNHAWGLAFDIDYPNNPYGKPPTIPPAAANIITSGGIFKWGKDFKDPSHFEYSGPLCK